MPEHKSALIRADAETITALLRGVAADLRLRLTNRQMEQLATYFSLLQAWNSKMNLTSLRRPEEIAVRHFGESLYLTGAVPKLQGGSEQSLLVDVGSGAGFPGLPIKIVWPGLHGVLLEPNQKKAAFLKEVIRMCGLEQAEVRSERLEEAVATELNGRASLVTVRAVAVGAEFLSLLCELLAPGGHLALFLGMKDAAAAQNFSGLQWKRPLLIPDSERRVILLGNKSNVPRGTSP